MPAGPTTSVTPPARSPPPSRLALQELQRGARLRRDRGRDRLEHVLHLLQVEIEPVHKLQRREREEVGALREAALAHRCVQVRGEAGHASEPARRATSVHRQSETVTNDGEIG
eukprot:scaffold41143_cov65-Phaeocystis_antarctica.AAC.6